MNTGPLIFDHLPQRREQVADGRGLEPSKPAHETGAIDGSELIEHHGAADASVTGTAYEEASVPYTIQFLGRPLGEAMLCRIGHTYEQATDWHTLHPDV